MKYFEDKGTNFTITLKEKEVVQEAAKEPDVQELTALDPTTIETEQTENKAVGLVKLIFEIIKKLVAMFANLFSKGE